MNVVYVRNILGKVTSAIDLNQLYLWLKQLVSYLDSRTIVDHDVCEPCSMRRRSKTSSMNALTMNPDFGTCWTQSSHRVLPFRADSFAQATFQPLVADLLLVAFEVVGTELRLKCNPSNAPVTGRVGQTKQHIMTSSANRSGLLIVGGLVTAVEMLRMIDWIQRRLCIEARVLINYSRRVGWFCWRKQTCTPASV